VSPEYSTNYHSSETGPVGQRNQSHCLVLSQEDVHTGKGAKPYLEILRKSCSLGRDATGKTLKTS